MALLLIKILILGFFINLVWEFFHSRLYETCRYMPKTQYRKLLLIMSAKDSFFIMLFFLISALLFRNTFILENRLQIAFFAFLSLSFSFVDEKISLNTHRWQYASIMPTFLGVGLTPLFEIVVTGIITFSLTFMVL